MTAREPLAALVARFRELLPIVQGPSASVTLRAANAERLLAAVEAGTKCYAALRRAERLLVKLEHGEMIRSEWDDTEKEAGIAEQEWRDVAE